MSNMLTPVTEAKPRLSELIRAAQDEAVVLVKHSRPVAVLASYDEWEDLHEQIEDLHDRLAAAKAKADPNPDYQPLDTFRDELGTDAE